MACSKVSHQQRLFQGMDKFRGRTDFCSVSTRFIDETHIQIPGIFFYYFISSFAIKILKLAHGRSIKLLTSVW